MIANGTKLRLLTTNATIDGLSVGDVDVANVSGLSVLDGNEWCYF